MPHKPTVRTKEEIMTIVNESNYTRIAEHMTLEVLVDIRDALSTQEEERRTESKPIDEGEEVPAYKAKPCCDFGNFGDGHPCAKSPSPQEKGWEALKHSLRELDEVEFANRREEIFKEIDLIFTTEREKVREWARERNQLDADNDYEAGRNEVLKELTSWLDHME